MISFLDLEVNDPGWYQMLTNGLASEQQKVLHEVIVLADQRKAAAESKRIEQSGGKSLISVLFMITPHSFTFIN